MILIWLYLGLGVLSLSAVSLVLYPNYRFSTIAKNSLLQVIFLLLMSIGLYMIFGGKDQVLANYERQNLAKKITLVESKDTPQAIARGFLAIEKELNTAVEWDSLGDVYSDKAVKNPRTVYARKQAMRLKPQETEYQLKYLVSLSMVNDGRLDDEALTLLNQLRTKYEKTDLSGNIIPVLTNLLALHEYSLKHYTQAIEYWQATLATLSKEQEESKTAVLEAINDAKHKLMLIK